MTAVTVTNHASDVDVTQFPLCDKKRHHSSNRGT